MEALYKTRRPHSKKQPPSVNYSKMFSIPRTQIQLTPLITIPDAIYATNKGKSHDNVLPLVSSVFRHDKRVPQILNISQISKEPPNGALSLRSATKSSTLL